MKTKCEKRGHHRWKLKSRLPGRILSKCIDCPKEVIEFAK